jgi:amino acid transporter
MSEEVRNSSIVIPKMLVQTILINGSLAFIFAIVILFTIGNIDQALSTSTGYPIIEVFYQATGSKKAATLMLISIIIVGVAGSMGVVASVSRLTWAFARDGGLPLSSFFAHVRRLFLLPHANLSLTSSHSQIDPKRHVPYRAIGLVCMTVALLSLINIGSSTALSAILGISTTSIVISYIIPISLLILKRLRNEPIPFGSWRLGRWGLPVNLYAATFGIFISVFALFPTTIPVTAPNMNYAGPILLGLIILASLDWLIRGRRGFKGPLKEMIQSEERIR